MNYGPCGSTARKDSLWRAALCILPVTLVCNIALNTLWLWMLQSGVLATFPVRAVKNLALSRECGAADHEAHPPHAHVPYPSVTKGGLPHVQENHPGRAQAALPRRGAGAALHQPYETLVATMLSAQCTDKQVNKVTPEVSPTSTPTPAMAACTAEGCIPW